MTLILVNGALLVAFVTARWLPKGRWKAIPFGALLLMVIVPPFVYAEPNHYCWIDTPPPDAPKFEVGDVLVSLRSDNE